MDLNNLRHLVFQLSDIQAKYQKHFVIVSSGAITAGAEHSGFIPKTIPEKQAAAAVGQPLLLQQYIYFFQEKGLRVGQILLTRDGLDDDVRSNHAKNTMLTLLNNDTIPIINENDSVAVDSYNAY